MAVPKSFLSTLEAGFFVAAQTGLPLTQPTTWSRWLLVAPH